MNTITLAGGGAGPSQAIVRPSGFGAGLSLHRAASALSMTAPVCAAFRASQRTLAVRTAASASRC